jgi:hypothetical protein
LVRGTTTVTPVLEKGLGCDTCGVSVMRMVRLPCATATLLMRTVSPITMTPVFSSITTLAGRSGSIGRVSMLVSSAAGSPPPIETFSTTVPESCG